LLYLQILPAVADGIIVLSTDIQNKDIVYSLLLILSGILMDSTGETSIILLNLLFACLFFFF
jgi:DNA repair/transcription protein MET18/MMS19